MDTVIQEIANQLGMTVDKAAQFITEQLPNFAALKSMQATVTLVIFSIVVILSLIFVIVSYMLTKNPDSLVVIISATIFLIGLCGLVFYSFYDIPKIIGWSNYPEAMLIDMALNAINL